MPGETRLANQCTRTSLVVLIELYSEVGANLAPKNKVPRNKYVLAVWTHQKPGTSTNLKRFLRSESSYD